MWYSIDLAVVKCPYLDGNNKITPNPYLVVCPGTLITQWMSELKTLFLPYSVDIFVYNSKVDGEVFWGLSGSLSSSVHKVHHRIVVASQSVCLLSC